MKPATIMKTPSTTADNLTPVLGLVASEDLVVVAFVEPVIVVVVTGLGVVVVVTGLEALVVE
jgi:hypothetical protein